MSAPSQILINRFHGTRMKSIGAIENAETRLALLAEEIGVVAKQAHAALAELKIETTHVTDFRHLVPLPKAGGLDRDELVSAFCFMGPFIQNGIAAFFLESGGASPSISPNLSARVYVSSLPIVTHSDWYEAAHDDPDSYFYKTVGRWRPEAGETVATIRLDADAPARINQTIMEAAAGFTLAMDIRNHRRA